MVSEKPGSGATLGHQDFAPPNEQRFSGVEHAINNDGLAFAGRHRVGVRSRCTLTTSITVSE